MEYYAKNIIEDIFEFIKTCPFADDYHIDFAPASIQAFSDSAPDGSALDYAGSVLMTDEIDLQERRFTKRQANFTLWLKRKSEYNLERQEVADFLFNFENWIEHCQAYNLTPKISDNDTDKKVERMWADNGIFFGEWDNEKTSLYMIQIHIEYYNRYEEIFDY